MATKDNFYKNIGNLGRIYNIAIEFGLFLSGPQRIALEGEWTENVQEVKSIGNSIVNRSITYRLAELDENTEADVVKPKR